jgi:hypothetical protein
MYKIISMPFSSLSECLKIYNDFLENENKLITQAFSQHDAGMVALFPVFFKDTVEKLRILPNDVSSRATIALLGAYFLSIFQTLSQTYPEVYSQNQDFLSLIDFFKTTLQALYPCDFVRPQNSFHHFFYSFLSDAALPLLLTPSPSNERTVFFKTLLPVLSTYPYREYFSLSLQNTPDLHSAYLDFLARNPDISPIIFTMPPQETSTKVHIDVVVNDRQQSIGIIKSFTEIEPDAPLAQIEKVIPETKKKALCIQFGLQEFSLAAVLKLIHDDLIKKNDHQYTELLQNNAADFLDSLESDERTLPALLQGSLFHHVQMSGEALHLSFLRNCFTAEINGDIRGCWALDSARKTLLSIDSLDRLREEIKTLRFFDQCMKGDSEMVPPEVEAVNKLIHTHFSDRASKDTDTVESLQDEVFTYISDSLKRMSFLPSAPIITLLSTIGIFVLDWDRDHASFTGQVTASSTTTGIKDPTALIIGYNTRSLKMCLITPEFTRKKSLPSIISPFSQHVDLLSQLLSEQPDQDTLQKVWATVRTLRSSHPNDAMLLVVDALLQFGFVPYFPKLCDDVPIPQGEILNYPTFLDDLPKLIQRLLFANSTPTHHQQDKRVLQLVLQLLKDDDFSDAYVRSLETIIDDRPTKQLNMYCDSILDVFQSHFDSSLLLKLTLKLASPGSLKENSQSLNKIIPLLHTSVYNYISEDGIDDFKLFQELFLTLFHENRVTLQGITLILSDQNRRLLHDLLGFFPQRRQVFFERATLLGEVEEVFIAPDGDCFFSSVTRMIDLKREKDKPLFLSGISTPVALRRHVASLARHTLNALRQVGLQSDDFVETIQALLASQDLNVQFNKIQLVQFVSNLNFEISELISNSISDMTSNPNSGLHLFLFTHESELPTFFNTFRTLFGPILTLDSRVYAQGHIKPELILDLIPDSRTSEPLKRFLTSFVERLNIIISNASISPTTLAYKLHPLSAFSELILEELGNQNSDFHFIKTLQDAYLADISLTFSEFKEIVLQKAAAAVDAGMVDFTPERLPVVVESLFSDFLGEPRKDPGYDYRPLVDTIIRAIPILHAREPKATFKDMLLFLLKSKWASQPEITLLSSVIPLEASILDGTDESPVRNVVFGQTIHFNEGDLTAARDAFNNPQTIMLAVHGNHYYGLNVISNTLEVDLKRKSSNHSEGPDKKRSPVVIE